MRKFQWTIQRNECPWKRKWIKRMSDYLKLRGYSQQTRKSYLGHVRRFVTAAEGSLERMTNEWIEKYLLRVMDENKSSAYMNQMISALKIFFKYIVFNEAATMTFPRE